MYASEVAHCFPWQTALLELPSFTGIVNKAFLRNILVHFNQVYNVNKETHIENLQ